MYWFAYNAFTSFFDLILLLVPMGKVPKGNGTTVVFMGEQLPPRIARMAKWLMRSGDFRIFLVCHKKGYFKEFAGEGFDSVILFRNQWHLFRILDAFPEKTILHGFAPKSFLADRVRKRTKMKYIHDMQDVYSIYYGMDPQVRWLRGELPHEKACLENADAVVAHSLEPNAAYRLFRTQKKPKNVFFHLGCDEDVFCENDKELGKEIHLVYAGGVAGSHRDPKQYGNTQFHKLIRSFSEQKIHFHIYPAPSSQEGDYEEYRYLGKTFPYFHFHESVPQQDLTAELSKYHFGILPFFREHSDQSDAKLKFATTLKLFNYLEAGIPVLVSADLGYQSWVIRRNRSGYVIRRKDLEHLEPILRSISYRELTALVARARKKMALSRQIQRLKNLYVHS